MVTAAQSTWQTAAARARDLLGIASAVTTHALTEEQAALLARYRQALRRRIEVADQLRETHNAVAAICLYREAFPLAVAAIALARTGDAAPNPAAGPAAIGALRALAELGRIPPLPAAVDRTAQRLSEVDLLAFDGDEPTDLLIKRDDAAAALKWLARLVGRAPFVRPRLDRGSAITLAVAVAGIAIVGAGLIWHAVRYPNLAFHRPVTVSSRHPRSTAPADNSGVVNGEIEKDYGIHTNNGPDAWVRIDLDGVRAVGDVKVYNRADSALDQVLPLTLEISEDGVTFTIVGQRSEHFTATEPWIADVGGRKARAIRVRSATYIALTEIEVYPR